MPRWSRALPRADDEGPERRQLRDRARERANGVRAQLAVAQLERLPGTGARCFLSAFDPFRRFLRYSTV